MTSSIPAIVDAHVHLWDPRTFRMPWLDGDAVLGHPFGQPEFGQASTGLNVEAIVYVQVDTTPAYGLLEVRWAAQREPAAIVGWAPMEDGNVVRTYLDALVQTPRVRGVRRLIQSESDPDFPMRLVEGLHILPDYGLSFDICIRHDQLARTVDMVRQCPHTDFILDHMAKPPIKAQQLEPWREQMTELAQLPNVVCKMSGLVTEADHENWTPRDLEPYINHVLHAFGEDRVLFGGDWPVVTLASSYRRWVDTLASYSTSPKLWRDNARRVYRLDA
ncbi:MAG TPA: amidohydrolase family protein [Chloroflexota bacterium]|jgi:L-fuconolactonase